MKRRPGRDAPRPAPRVPRVEPAPPLARDPWAWASLLAMLPLLVRCFGAPLGEPVAEDFDFLKRSLWQGTGSLLDGGGSTAFWRPVAHQLYYAMLGPLIVSHPRVIAALHALLLAAGALLLYRALRPSLPGATACMAASFPCFAESTRTLVGWPSQFVDVGLFFFSAVALHEASRRRLWSALAAALLALGCKELAVITVLLLPWLPGVLTRRERVRWLAACGALLAVWGGAYLAVRHAAGLSLPHGVEHDATPLLARFGWALRGSLRAAASLTLNPDAHEALALGIGIAIVAVIGLTVTLSPAARVRFAAKRAWMAFGLAWFTAAAAALTAIFPLWQPNRAHFGSAGLGIAAAVACEAVHPALGGALVLGRGVLLALAPGAAVEIAQTPANSGAFMDFAQLTRLQRFMELTRRGLKHDYATAPSQANLIEMNFPYGLIYAFGGDHAVQVWYRDSTLRMVNFTALERDSSLSVLAGVQFQPHGTPQVVVLPPAAMRAQQFAYRELRAHRWQAGVAAVDHADSLLPDPRYSLFHGDNAGYRAFGWLELGRTDEAVAECRRAMTLDDLEPNAFHTLAKGLALQGHVDEALAVLDEWLRIRPGDPNALALRERIVAPPAAARAH